MPLNLKCYRKICRVSKARQSIQTHHNKGIYREDMGGGRCLASSVWVWLHPAQALQLGRFSSSARISIGRTRPSWIHLYSTRQSCRTFVTAVQARDGTFNVKCDKPRSSELVDMEYAELNLKQRVGEVGAVRIRQHVNPLAERFMIPIEPPNWEAVFDDTRLPLMVDIGSGSGRFLVLLAKRFSGSKNFMGLEIRKKLVERSQFWVKELALTNIHFMIANATVSFGTLVSSYPGPLTRVSILCPDPHFKKRHHKRRILQKPLVDAILENLASGGQIFIQSDIKEVAIDMREQFDAHLDSLDTMDAHHSNSCDDDGWLLENPMGIRTEREIHAESEGGTIYRRIYAKR